MTFSVVYRQQATARDFIPAFSLVENCSEKSKRKNRACQDLPIKGPVKTAKWICGALALDHFSPTVRKRGGRGVRIPSRPPSFHATSTRRRMENPLRSRTGRRFPLGVVAMANPHARGNY